MVESLALELDAVALLALPDGALALWSEPAGLFGRRLDPDGTPRARTRRIGRRCGGGFSAIGSTGEVHVACLDAGSEASHPASAPIPPRLRWHRLDGQGRLVASRVVAPVGPLSQGVAIAAPLAKTRDGAEPEPWVVWQDASAAAQIAWATHLTASDLAPPVRLSAVGRAAGHPAVVVDRRGPFAVWPETYLEDGEPRGELVGVALGADADPPGGGSGAVRLASRRRILLRVHHDASRPQLLHGPVAGRVLAFRDRRRKGQRTGLFLAALSEAGRIPEAVRVARADGDARPALCACGGRLFAATPRTYAGDYFVGLNVVARDLSRAAPEQQFYEDAHAFSKAAAACVGGRPLLLIGERARLSQTRSRLRAVPILCDLN